LRSSGPRPCTATVNDGATEDFASIAADTDSQHDPVLMFHKVSEGKIVQTACTSTCRPLTLWPKLLTAGIRRNTHVHIDVACGHLLPEQAPQAVTDALVPFLDTFARHPRGQYPS
jgi:hypothetical protein